MRFRLLGLPVDALTIESTTAAVEAFVRAGGVHQHVVLNASKVVQAQKDSALRSAIEGCDLVSADGMSVVWAGRLLGVPIPERVTGIDLMERLFSKAAEHAWPVYLLGARQEVVERVVAIESQRHARLRIAGYRNGYWAPADEGSIVADIAAAAPTLLFVAMPSPAKEEFIARHRDALRIPFVMGVGGSFDVVSGTTRRAPLWMQRAGLEWFYRLKQEPRRMARRYIVGNARFIALVTREWQAMRRRKTKQ